MSSSEYEIRRLEDKISDLNKKIEENDQISKRNDERERWDMDRLRREFSMRRRGYEHNKKALAKELKEVLTRHDRVQYQIAQEKKEELEESRERAGTNFNHRIH